MPYSEVPRIDGRLGGGAMLLSLGGGAVSADVAAVVSTSDNGRYAAAPLGVSSIRDPLGRRIFTLS
jgi:hypothetical protein